MTIDDKIGKELVENMIKLNGIQLVVTPTFYKILEDKYGKEWAEKNCYINRPVPRTKPVAKKS
jgi:hypothetical protein